MQENWKNNRHKKTEVIAAVNKTLVSSTNYCGFLLICFETQMTPSYSIIYNWVRFYKKEINILSFCGIVLYSLKAVLEKENMHT